MALLIPTEPFDLASFSRNIVTQKVGDLTFTRIFALKALSKWQPEYDFDSLLSEIHNRNLFGFDDEEQAELRFYQKWRAEYEKQTNEGRFVYVQPKNIFTEDDIAEFVTECRKRCSVPIHIPDHPNLSLLGELLEFTSVERDALNFALSIPAVFTNSAASVVWTRIKALDRAKTIKGAYELFLGFSEEEFKSLQESSLRKSGVLLQDQSLLVVHPALSDVFRYPNLTSDYIEETLFPSSISTELNVSDYPHISKDINRVIQIVERGLSSRRPGNNIMLWGSPGTGKTELVLAMAKKQGWNLRTIGDISTTDDHEKSRGARIASLKLALKVLANDPRAVLLFDEMEDLFKVDNNAVFSKAFINRIIETANIPIIWTTNSLMALEHSVLRRMVYNILLEIPPAETRIVIWKKYCREIGLRLSQDAIVKLANKYDIAPALIRNAVAVSYAVVGDKKGKRAEQEVHEVVENLDRLVSLGVQRHKEDEDDREYPYDISCVNSDTDVDQLTHDIVDAAPRWSLCLFGAPGTGKSEYGRYLAKKLGKKLVLKRASDLTSMWVGETEKNIARAFQEARENEHILLIDEGDSFLRSREKAKNSWEITAVNEMLSQMERHTQPFILTTNLMNDLDSASLRRFTFKLKFDYLEPEQAKKLFRQYFDKDAPAAIERNYMLAPGDFACVKSQVDIRRITDPNAIYALLKAETDLKPQSRGKIGF